MGRILTSVRNLFSPHRIQSMAVGLFIRPIFWIFIIACAFAIPLTKSFMRKLPDPPPLLSQLPQFELTDQDGKTFGSVNLQGKVWVANFIFTSCGMVCPQLTAQMAKIQHRLRHIKSAIHLVSVSVDPIHDTPQRLQQYAASYHADKSVWTFLTGSTDNIKQTVVQGFKMAFDAEIDPEGDGGFFNIVHGERFVLVDKKGTIRGYYEANPSGIDNLVRDVGLLVNFEERI